MNSRKYHTDPEELLRQGKEIMSSSEESKYYFRVFAVNMVLSGTPASSVALSSGFTKAAVTGWVKAVDEHGFQALIPKKQSGRPKKLTDDQRKDIDELLQKDPKDCGYKVWDGPTVSDYIKKKFGIDMSTRQCQRLFHELGYSKIRPQMYPSKGYEDTEERTAFKKNCTSSPNPANMS